MQRDHHHNSDNSSVADAAGSEMSVPRIFSESSRKFWYPGRVYRMALLEPSAEMVP